MAGWAIGLGGLQRLGLEHRSRAQCWGRVLMMFAKKKDDMKVSQLDSMDVGSISKQKRKKWNSCIVLQLPVASSTRTCMVYSEIFQNA